MRHRTMLLLSAAALVIGGYFINEVSANPKNPAAATYDFQMEAKRCIASSGYIDIRAVECMHSAAKTFGDLLIAREYARQIEEFGEGRILVKRKIIESLLGIMRLEDIPMLDQLPKESLSLGDKKEHGMLFRQAFKLAVESGTSRRDIWEVLAKSPDFDVSRDALARLRKLS